MEQPQKSSLAIIVVVLIIVVVAVGIYEYIRHTSSAQPVSLTATIPIATTTPTISTSALVTYKSLTGYSFSYPQSWTPYTTKPSNPKGEYDVFASADTVFANNNITNIDPAGLPATTTIGQYLEFDIGTIKPVSVAAFIASAQPLPYMSDFASSTVQLGPFKALEVTDTINQDPSQNVNNTYKEAVVFFFPNGEQPENPGSPLILLGVLKYVAQINSYDSTLMPRIISSFTAPSQP